MKALNLLFAAQSGNVSILKLLIDSGADIAVTSDEGKTALHIAALQGSVKSVQLLLDAGADVSACDTRGNSADPGGHLRQRNLV